MIQSKTRIRLTWYTAVALTLIIGFSVYKEMNDVATSAILAYTGIVGGYIAAKTINNQALIKDGNKDKIT